MCVCVFLIQYYNNNLFMSVCIKNEKVWIQVLMNKKNFLKEHLLNVCRLRCNCVIGLDGVVYYHGAFRADSGVK